MDNSDNKAGHNRGVVYRLLIFRAGLSWHNQNLLFNPGGYRYFWPSIEVNCNFECHKMNQELSIRIILENPPTGVDFGIQKGSGNQYETILNQRSIKNDLCFEFKVFVRESKSSLYNFTGPYVQGPSNERFIYIDIGTAAGQINSAWNRRLKIPLRDISSEMITQMLANSSLVLETKVAGTGKDGGPNCATVKPFPGWHLSPGL